MIFALFAISLHVSAAEIPLPPEFAPVQESFFRRSYADFAAKVSAKLPELKLPTTSSFTPAYRARLTRRGWVETFVNEVAENAGLGEADRQRLHATAEDLFFSYHHNEGYPRFPFLAASVEAGASGKSQSGREHDEVAALPASHPNEPHTLNLKAYVDERFPIELQDFVRKQRVPLVLDAQGCVRSIHDQRAKGFTRVIRFSNPRDYAESPTYFAQNPAKQQTRFVVCDLYGEDDLARAREIYGPSFAANGGRVLRHANRDPLLKFKADGENLVARDARDIVIVGFQNTVWWQLKTADPDWSRTVLTDDGVEVSLFERPRTGERVVSVANVFGDEMTEVLSVLHERGFRRFVYLGTAGGLDPALSIGDLLVPTHFRGSDGHPFVFENSAKSQVIGLPEGNKVWRESQHGWVPNLIVETQRFLLGLQKQRVQAIDIEALYFARFFKQNPVLLNAAYVLVSDLPLHGASYDKEDASRDRPMKSLQRILPMIFPRMNPAN